jgi:Protein of unknown function (DUF2809)
VRIHFALCLLLAGGLGCATIFYRGPGSAWTSDHLGGFFYVLAWIFLILTLFPMWSPGKVALGVLIGTCGLEFMQLWNPEPLQAVRSTFLGHVVLGSTFSWTDFPWYGLGALAGLGLARRVTRHRGTMPIDSGRTGG